MKENLDPVNWRMIIYLHMRAKRIKLLEETGYFNELGIRKKILPSFKGDLRW